MDNELELFRDNVSRFFADEILPSYEEWEHAGIMPREVWTKMGEAGLLCVDVAGLGSRTVQAGGAKADAFIKLHPIGRPGTGEEVAQAVRWLCSPEASFVTGDLLMVDGGYSAR